MEPLTISELKEMLGDRDILIAQLQKHVAILTSALEEALKPKPPTT